MESPYNDLTLLEIITITKMEGEKVMKAEMEETNCLLDEAGKGSVKTSVQVPVKGITVHKSVIKGGTGKPSCLLDGGKGIVHVKKVMIPLGWKILKEVSVTKYHPDPVEYAMEEKEKIPGGWNSQIKTNNTEYYPDPIQSALEKKEPHRMKSNSQSSPACSMHEGSPVGLTVSPSGVVGAAVRGAAAETLRREQLAGDSREVEEQLAESGLGGAGRGAVRGEEGRREE